MQQVFSSDQLLHSIQIREVAQASFHTEALERTRDEIERVAKHVARSHDILSCCGQSEEGVADGGHTGIDGYNGGSTSEGFHLVFKISDGGIAAP